MTYVECFSVPNQPNTRPVLYTAINILMYIIKMLLMDKTLYFQRRLNTETYAVSPDRRYVLLAYDIIRVCIYSLIHHAYVDVIQV